jgi:hypothetical protein
MRFSYIHNIVNLGFIEIIFNFIDSVFIMFGNVSESIEYRVIEFSLFLYGFPWTGLALYNHTGVSSIVLTVWDVDVEKSH